MLRTSWRELPRGQSTMCRASKSRSLREGDRLPAAASLAQWARMWGVMVSVQPDGSGALRPATRACDVGHGNARVEQALGPSFAHGVAGVGRGVEAGGAERLAKPEEETAPGKWSGRPGRGRHHEQRAVAVVEWAHVRVGHAEVLAHGAHR